MSASLQQLPETGTATYSDNAQHAISQRTVSDDSGGLMKLLVTARRASDGAVKTFDLEFGFKKLSGHDVVIFGLNLLGVKGTVADLLALLAVSVTVDSYAADSRVLVTGLSSTEIDWSYQMSGQELSHV